MTNQFDIDNLVEMLTKGKVEEVFSILNSSNLDVQLKKKIIALNTRYNDLKKKKIQGVIDFNQETIELNRINNSVLELVFLTQKKEEVDSKNKMKKNRAKKSIIISMAFLTFLIITVYVIKSFVFKSANQGFSKDDVVNNSFQQEPRKKTPTREMKSYILEESIVCDEELSSIWKNSLNLKVNLDNLEVKNNTRSIVFYGQGDAPTNESEWKIMAKRIVLANISAYIRENLKVSNDKKQFFCSGEIISLQFIEGKKQVKITFQINL